MAKEEAFEVQGKVTQALANTSYGPAGLRYLAAGLSPQDALDRLTGADPDALLRPAGIRPPGHAVRKRSAPRSRRPRPSR